MATLDELLEQEKQLKEQIEKVRKEERGAAIEQIKALVEKYQIQSSSIFGRKRTKRAETTEAGEEPPKPKTKLPPKYRDPETGKTWTGRGNQPKWLEGKNKEDYLIREETSENVEATETTES